MIRWCLCGVVAVAVVGSYPMVWRAAQADIRSHAMVVFNIDPSKPFGPYYGKCLDLFRGRPACVVDDRKRLDGNYYPPNVGLGRPR